MNFGGERRPRPFPKALNAMAPFLVAERVVDTMHTLCFLFSLVDRTRNVDVAVVVAVEKVGRFVGLVHCEPLSSWEGL